MEKRERLFLIFCLILSLFVIFETWRLGIGTPLAPGSGFFPLGAALIIFLSTVALLLKGRGRRLNKHPTPFFQEKSARKIICMLLFLFIYPLLMNWLGFFLCTLFFVGFSLKVIEPQPWKVVFVVSIGIAIGCYLLFDIWMNVQLPKGVWVTQLFRIIGDLLWK